VSGSTSASGWANAGGYAQGGFVFNAVKSNQYSHANTGGRGGTSFGSASENSAVGVAAGNAAHSKVAAGGSSSSGLSTGHR